MAEEMRNNNDEVEDDVMLPGFRFHPTDEELVGFYLRRKLHQLPLSIELIRQLDIYKYDPWDLPKMATTGEKEWYFYCPRDRKYRNSARPNRVTGAGFWKATGTDRPIYSTNATRCIGLKKSLVFYRGRAAKALKTDWMMHEFRLPPHSTPPNDSWAICRIFKKTNITAQRAVSSTKMVPEDHAMLYKAQKLSTDETGLISSSKTSVDLPSSTDLPCNFTNSYDPFDYFQGKLPQLWIPNEPFGSPAFTFPPMEASDVAKSAMDVSSILLNMSSSMLGDFDSSHAVESSDPPQLPALPPNDMTFPPPQMAAFNEESAALEHVCEQWETLPPIGYPLSCIWEKLLN